MKHGMRRIGAWTLALAMLGTAPAQATEVRLGDYIYVPASSAQQGVGATLLRVTALNLGADSDEPVDGGALAGAEFGVYVISGTGEVRAWADPLYPSEPMRIRTGEGETRFTLPEGMEFYLRQESAPQGYAFDGETLIPVTGEEIVVRNAMYGELVLRAQDSIGNPIAGVPFTVTYADGRSEQLVSDASGEAVVRAAGGEVLTVGEGELAQGVYPAEIVRCGEQEQRVEGEAAPQAQVTLAEAARTRLTFVHPAPGSVQLAMTLSAVDANGEQTSEPLEGVRLTVEGETPVTAVTDAQGRAEIALLRGTYGVTLAYEGELDVQMPLERGQVIVENGSATVIELEAADAMGRVAVQLEGERVGGGDVTLESAATGETFGPYAFDEEGLAVSDRLAAGEYHIAALSLPQDTQIGGAASGEQSAGTPDALALHVTPGALTQASIALLTLETQRFSLMLRAVDERGELTSDALAGVDEFELIASDGSSAGFLDAQGGGLTVTALSGSYALRMAQEQADALGVASVSDAFTLPAQAETISFAAVQGRAVITATDERGRALAGVQYAITDAAGSRTTVTTDDAGQAVSATLGVGEARIETLAAPADHDAAPETAVQIAPGEAARVEIAHESYGCARLSVGLLSLDEQGNDVVTPMAGVGIRVYSVAGDEMTDTGIAATTGEDGVAALTLPEGEYVAQIDAQALTGGVRAAQGVRLTLLNTQEIEQQLTCMAAEGGVRVSITGGELTQQQLAQVRFELVATDGTATGLTMQGGAFYAGGLAAGVYVLRQTQIPEGYTLASERTLNVSGGEVTAVDVPLEEYAVVSVTKSGLTFTDDLRTYVVPLSGEYGVYTMEEGEMKPYPSASRQMTVWANVTPEEIAQGRSAQVKLPATIEGTTYYLKETAGAQGFAADEQYVEVTLHAGEDVCVERTVSSDRGFFTFALTDAATGERVAGGEFELIDEGSGEVVLSFISGEEPYRNEMAIPVGSYALRQTQAAPGYALADGQQTALTIEPYLTQGGTMTDAAMACLRLPQGEAIEGMQAELYAAEQQGLTLVTFEAGQMPAGERLAGARTTLEIASATGERVNIDSVVISGVGDAQGTAYRARVEYCLTGGGWQPSDARMTGVLTGPTAVSLADVTDDVCAVRVTYIADETGEERTGSGFTPGQTAVSVRVSAQAGVHMTAQASFGGKLDYRTAYDGALMTMARATAADAPFEMQGSGVFETVSPGRDGRISGVAFFDEDGDGVLDAGETGRYAGMNVILHDRNGDVVETARTGTDGTYAFGSLPSGTYSVQFDAGDALVYSANDLYSAHVTSGVADSRTGVSAEIVIDGDHTDALVNAGCIYAARVSGAIRERLAGGEVVGRGGVSVELMAVDGEDDEPLVIMTDESGEFCFTGLMPGAYRASVVLPDGYLCEQMDEGQVQTEFELAQSGEGAMGEVVIERSAALSGQVRVDDDGDGAIAQGAQAMAGVRVALLRARDGHTEEVARTTTDEAGAYAFDGLYPGEYSVLFELEEGWTFTRYGEDSLVYGAVSASGSTRAIELAPGQRAEGVNAGVTLSAQLTVTVFKDTQYDGQMGAYEELFGGVSVTLIRQEGGEDAEAISYRTDEQGAVVFSGISPGEYVIAYQLPGQWRATRQVSAQESSNPVSGVPASMASAGRSLPFTLSMGQNVRMYIGAMLSGTISGRAYYDDDADAECGADESPVGGVTVELLDAQGELTAVTSTLEDGTYAFEGLAPGRYTVRFTAQEDACFSASARSVVRGGVQASEGHVSTTRAITVKAGEVTATADAGIVRLSAVSGAVWEDRDVNGLHGEGESGLSGVSVSLMNGAGRTILATATTDAQGHYAFTGLMPGDYVIRVDLPEGYVFSGAETRSALALERQEDGRGYSAAFTLLGGVDVQDAGYYGAYTQGVISGRVWDDANYDGAAGEAEGGLRGARLTLTDEAGAQHTAQTGRSGEFTFDELAPGRYTLRVDLPEGYVFTAEGGQSIAPRMDAQSVSIELGELAMGQTLGGVAIGALKPAQVSGIVWADADDDGRRRSGDQGVGGVAVTLTALGGPDAGKTYTAVTDETGAYAIAGVMPGDVQLTYTLAEGTAFARNASGSRISSVPMTDALTASGEAFTLKEGESRGGIDVGVVGVGVVEGTAWTDADYDGARGGESGLSGVTVTLADAATGAALKQTQTDENGAYRFDFVRKGTYLLCVQLPDGMIFTRAGQSALADVDEDIASTPAFELAMGEGRTGVDIGAIVPAAITGCVAIDENEDGVAAAGEAGMPGVTVTALSGGTVVATAQTGQDGSFAFDTLRPGTYRVRYTLPEDALFSLGVALATASDDALEGETDSRKLAMGEQAALEPVAAVRGASIAGIAFMDANVSGRPEADEARIEGVEARLLNADGQEIAVRAMGETGEYAFTRLRSGVYSLRFTLPEGMLLADHTGEPDGSCVPVTPGNVGQTEPFALAMGQAATMNIGGIEPGSIGDTVFLDSNGNGLQDYREPLLSGAELILLRVNADGTTQEAARTTSDEYGYYVFGALRPGSYVVQVALREGDTLTYRFGEPMGEIDSDIDPDSGLSDVILLQSGQTLRNIDVGYTEFAGE